MKKIRNLVIGGIETKIFNLILVTLLLSAAVFLLVTLVHGKMLSQLTEETGQRQREAISGITDTVMDRVVEESLGKTSLLRADVSDDMFSDLRDRVEMLAFYAEKLFSDPSAAPAAYAATTAFASSSPTSGFTW